MRRAARTDSTHAAIRDGLRALGCVVHDLAAVGGGVPDLLVGARGRWVLIEAKSPKKSLRGKPQEDFHALATQRGLPCAVAHDLEEAVDAVFERQRSNGK